MSTPITLLGYQWGTGASTDNSTTDVFMVAGQANTVQSQYGNLSVTGFNGGAGIGLDYNTWIDIGGSGVTDTIVLDGNTNQLDDSAASNPGDHSFSLSGATVTFTVNGTGANAGSNTVNLDNAGGANTIKVGGDGNTVDLYDAATNTVTLSGTSGGNTVMLTPLTGTAYATSNTVTATKSTGGNTIDAAGATNTIKVGGATNTINAAGSANVVTAAGVGNTINLIGDATNTVTSGAGASITLNGDATNTVTSGAGASITIGSQGGDGLFGYASTVTLAGAGNYVGGGDENYLITGGVTGNTIELGDGNSTVVVKGTGNTISVNGGSNSINAGGGGASVSILGFEGLGLAPPADADSGNPGVPVTPTDFVTIAGQNDTVTATYEDVTVSGSGVTSAATIALGDGANKVTLGGTGSNTVTVGNGNNTIAASGSLSTYDLGVGLNYVSLTGNSNTVTVSDSYRGEKALVAIQAGQDIVNLGAGTGDNVQFGYAGGSVKGTGLGTTTVGQSGSNVVTVNLNNGTGLVTLGDGSDSVTANGNGSQIALGAGSDTVVANGKGDSIAVNNDGGFYTNNNVTANGAGDTITIGTAGSYGGTNTVQATGTGDTITINSDNASTNLAAGSNDTITFNGGSAYFAYGDTNTVTAGSGNTLVFNGSFNDYGVGDSNTVTATSGNTITFNDNFNYYGSDSNTVSVTSGNKITFNDGFTYGQDHNTVTATSGNNITFNDAGANDVNTATVTTGSKVTFNSLSSSLDKFTVGAPGSSSAGTTVAETNGTSVGVANGGNDVFLLNGVNAGSTLSALFGKETIKFGLDSSDKVSLSTAANNDVIAVTADTAAGGYAGKIEIAGFSNGDVLDLQGLVGGIDGHQLSSFAEDKANWTQAGGNTTIHLAGGGSILLDNITTFTTGGAHASFAWHTNFGAVS